LPAPPLSRALAEAALAAYRTAGSKQAAAKLLNLPLQTFRSRLVRAEALLGGHDGPGTAPSESLIVTGDHAEVVRRSPDRVRTLADLIRVCEIDTAEWEVERWVANKWEQAAMDAARQPIVTPLWQVKAWLVRKTRTVRTLDALRTALVRDIRTEVRRRHQPAATPKAAGKGWLFEFTPFDLHLGKYTWDAETVTNYDADIAADLFNASLDFLLGRALKLTDGKLERVLCVFGNDVSHVDSKKGETTAGTRMDVDTRYIRVYRRIVEIHRRAVDLLRQVAPVDIVVVPGNHDELTSFHLGEILAARYDTVKHVTVDNAPRLRKYYEFGTNLFGFTHGDSEKVSELPLLMAREMPDAWARCTSREWHIGHKHIAEQHAWRGAQDLFSDKGVRIRRLASLSAHDAWHTKFAYVDRRACDSFLFHKVAGFTDHLSFNVDHASGRALGK
jgi:3',5'-cyclic AMP phosphodiesterase CpdA